MKSPLSSLFLFLLRAYKLTISPYLGQNCRFYPSCSAYADIAIRRHGVLKGSLLAGKRLCKCHPWHEGGIDLVPESEIKHAESCDLPTESGLKLARSADGVLKSAANDQFSDHASVASAPSQIQHHTKHLSVIK